MEDQKSPGIDGIPIIFYKEYYNLLENDLHLLYSNILFKEKQTPTIMKQAIITLIPKNIDELEDLKNWRPNSLLYIDYKILTKILANRLKNILPHIISQEQNCSIPNRNIFNNIFLIRDAIRYNKEKNTHFYIMQVDQEKPLTK